MHDKLYKRIMSAPDMSSVTPELIDVGLLINLLTGTKANPSFNSGWFSNPEAGFNTGFNWPNLQPLVEKLLGKAANPLSADAGILDESWYSIKINDNTGNPTDSGFYFVEKTSGDNALLGLGAEHTFTIAAGGETITINPFIYLPIFSMPGQSGVTPIFSVDTKGPVEIGVEVSLTGTFSQSGTAYNGMLFVASFDFTATAPTLIFKLREPSGDYVDADTANADAVINTVLGLTPVVTFLDSNVLPETAPVNFSWGTLFNTAGWLTTPASPYTVVSPIVIPTTPAGIEDYITTLLLNALKQFLGQNTVIPLISKAGTAGSPSWSVNLVLDGGRYGINIQVTDITVNSSPQISIQIGAATKDGTDWITKAGGTDPQGTGLNFYLLSGTAPNIAFDPGFELINVGFDILNSNGQPLFDINGFAMNEAQLRGFFSTLQSDAWGVAAAIDSISLPLVPPSGSTSDSVPATLMSSADSGGGSGDSKPAVNPQFSFLAAYVSSFYFQLFDSDGKPEDIVILPIQKAFGPVELKDVGIGWSGESSQLLFQLDGSLKLNALNIDLEKLTVGFPVTTPADISTYSLDLDGMGISFAGGPVTISGGFLKDTSTTPAEYNGAVSIQVASWGITALGSFASLNGNPSLFIFGVLNAELGGPPFFFITGAAVGFGYNRQIIMPTITNVVNFPFVQAANNPELFSGSGTDDVLKSISQYIPPELGEYWLAAGVKFTSFEVLNSFALLMIQFGKNFEVNLLGTSTIQLPKQGEGTSYVYAEMALEAIFEPSLGLIAVQAQLTDNSYVIDPACVLTGGFAFYSWFKGSPNSGDFVVTLGGYNAAFVPPDYYPTVPRLGFNWNVSTAINISGDVYFALTPSCVMAGGKLWLVYSDGDLNAWFKAWADFLISWKPFHYDISIGITIGVSYKLNVLFVHTTISVQLGVDVEIYGPDFGGTAYVNFYIVSFTVGFGANKNQPAKVEWTDFQSYFLPQAKSGQQDKLSLSYLNATSQNPAANDDNPPIVKINTNAGLVDTFNFNGEAIWIVDPSSFAFNTDSAVPATQIGFAPGPGNSGAPAPINCNDFGVKPVGSMTLSGTDSLHYITLTKQDEGDSNYSPYSMANWLLNTTPVNAPQALWGTVNTGAETPSATSVPNIVHGLASAAPNQPTTTGPAAFAIDTLADVNIETLPLPITPGTASSIELSSAGSIDQIAATLYNTSTASNQCTPLFDALQSIGSLATQNDSLALMAQSADDIFNGSPMLAPTNSVSRVSGRRAARYAKQGKATAANRPASREVNRLTSAVFNYRFGKDTASSAVVENLLSRGRDLKSAIAFNKDGSFSLQAGQVLTWELNVAGNEQLQYDGSLPLRVIFFDINIELIADETILKGSPGSLQLPVKAKHMVIRVMDDVDSSMMGWRASSQLPLLNPKYLMGRGCLIRPQSPHRTGRKQFTCCTGLSDGSKVILKNSVRRNDIINHGWIETLFPSTVKEVFVTGRTTGTQEIKDNAFEARVIYKDAAGKKQAIAVSTNSTGSSGCESWYKFVIPQEIDSRDFSIWIKPLSSVAISGVAGTTKSMESLSEDQFAELARHESALTYDNMNKFTTLTLDNILDQH